MKKEIASRYNPRDVEPGIYKKWEEAGYFTATPDPRRRPFTIVIPPPNVTGILHMGHALNNTIQDILIRWRRMQGYNALWVPGTDHAGIATQNVVERKLLKEGKKREDIGRERFVEEVWEWRRQYGDTIIRQLKRLGASCDWGRTRFTMDEGLTKAVLEAFERLYKKGLIYRGNYIINWCPRCQTALSDEEAPRVETEGKLYYIRYPFLHSAEGRAHNEGVVVATTRPETMLGDVAVAVNPGDPRYSTLIGKKLILPLVEREIEIIGDDFVDMEFGTGAVKVTPAHDPDDFEMSVRHGLKPVKIMGPDGKMNENAMHFKGMDRFEARRSVVEELKKKKFLLKVEKHKHAVGHCYRCDTVIEPYLSLQWFVRMKPLARPAIEAVTGGRIKFYPDRWTKVYLNWMENIKDWCISRQIWWGHRLPVYYCQDCMRQAGESGVKDLSGDGVIVSRARPEKCPACGSNNITQDEDVLDTWFSSWLWPFSTLGWPEKTRDMEYFYPTSVLVTAPEILFFWVARMIMSGLEFVGDIPFRDVYLHGTVRDLTGKKMSKSLGNIIDPIDIINEFGADALRYSMIAITATGQDVFLSREKFEIGRNFANKIWNASRFALLNIAEDAISLSRDASYVKSIQKKTIIDRWVLSAFHRAAGAVTTALEGYRFNEAESIIYDFFWHGFCDWYVETVKPYLAGKIETQAVLLYVLRNALKLLHPFMPFVTEAIWQNIENGPSIMKEAWPLGDESFIDSEAEMIIALMQDIVTGIRNVRSDMNIPYSAEVSAVVIPEGGAGTAEVLMPVAGHIKRLARVKDIVTARKGERPAHSASVIVEGYTIYIPLEGVIDVEAERKRLSKKLEEVMRQLSFADNKLKNKSFVEKAPPEVVESERERKKKLEARAERIKKSIGQL